MPHDRRALEEELERLARAARVRRSVDGFTRAAVEGFCWAVVAGICGRLLWDSSQPPIFLWPMLLLDVLLLWDALAPEMDFVEAQRVVSPAKSPLSYEGFAFPCGYRETNALRLRVQPPPYFIVGEVQHLLLSRQ